MKNKRIGNIEWRPIFDGSKYSAEIVHWYPNPCYGKEKEYEQDKWDPEYYIDPAHPFCRMHQGCFKNKENCYVVAWITDGEEPDVVSVGDRPWTLEAEDKKNFEELILLFFKYGEDFGDDTEEDEG